MNDTPMVEVVMPLNRLANRCGYFFNCCRTAGYEDKPTVNNGYNCNHPDCGDTDEGIGKCLASACPLAYPADGLTRCEQCKECESCGDENCECDDDLMVVSIPQSEFNGRYMELVQPEPDEEGSNEKMSISFAEALKAIIKNPDGVKVGFSFINDVGERVDQENIQLTTLYEDWYDECVLCPPNDAKIKKACIQTEDGQEFALNDDDLEFGDFMDALEAHFGFNAQAFSFAEALTAINGNNPEKIYFDYSFINDEGERVDRKDNHLPTIYEDWYGECDLCPSNDAKIMDVRIRTDSGQEFALNDDDLEFCDFMDALATRFGLNTQTMNKQQFRARLSRDYNIPDDNCTLAPHLLDAILDYAEGMDSDAQYNFLCAMFQYTSVEERLLQRVEY